MPQTRNRREGDRKRAVSEAIDENGKLENMVTLDDSTGCCCPSGCLIGETIDCNDPDDATQVVCTNPDCRIGRYMHRVCFESWEATILTHVRNCGRARNWSEKQMFQNLWTKKGFDVAFRACGCKCGHGHLRKDLEVSKFNAVQPEDDGRKRRNRKKSGSKQLPITVTANGTSALGPRARSRTLSLGSASTLFSTSPPNQIFAHSLGAAPKTFNGNLDFFSDVQVQNTGSIFQRRDTMASFYEILPPWKVNGIHIKMEDDCPQGNDETHIFVLTSLGDHKMRNVRCVLCKSALAVYDKYPLLDGTLFLSPMNHDMVGIKVRHDSREGYLFALCVSCLEHSDQFGCSRCGANKWFLDRLVLGTLYYFDVLASPPCCPPVCNSCRIALPLPPTHNFSSYSEPFACPNCGYSDLHYIRKLENLKRSETAASA